MLRHLSLVLAALVLLPGVAARAEGILDHLPADVAGFVIVQDLAGSSARVEKVMALLEEVMEVKPTAPWDFVKGRTGLGPGIDESGDALLAILVDEEDITAVKPVLLLSVSDYGAFAESVGGDASGEISRVTVSGEEVLAARRGAYAMLMNTEHRPTMELLLAGAADKWEGSAELSAWLQTQNAAVIVARAGVEALTAAARGMLAGHRASLEQLDAERYADTVNDAISSLEMAEQAVAWVNSGVEAVAIGLSIDDATNVRVSNEIRLRESGGLAGASELPKGEASPIVGQAAAPFVFAAGGPIPDAWVKLGGVAARKAIEREKDEYGFENFGDEDWQQVEKWFLTGMEGLKSGSLAMFIGDEDDALVSNVFAVLKVVDSGKYLESTRESSEIWNGLLDKSTNEMAIKLKYELQDGEIAGKKALIVSADALAAAEDPNVPMIKPLMETAFGEGGKMRAQFIAADETTVVMAVADDAEVEKAVEFVLGDDAGLGESADVKPTTALLDSEAAWQILVSPQGVVAWSERLMQMVASTFGGDEVDLPDYPNSPPAGLSIALLDKRLRVELVWPAEALKGIAEYVKRLKAAG